MALVDNALKNALLAVFEEMTTSPMSNADYAAKIAKAIDDQIKTATVSAGIVVTIPTTSPPGSPSAGTTTGTGMIT
jgi:flagellar basal body-associated protein FliL